MHVCRIHQHSLTHYHIRRQNCVVRNDLLLFPKWHICCQDTERRGVDGTQHVYPLCILRVHGLYIVHEVTCAHTLVQGSDRGYILHTRRQISHYGTHFSAY
jgi:hypothetical protein